MTMNAPTSVLFVCLGNICRSPSAEAVMTAKTKNKGLKIRFDSAGTANYHVGSPPDKRAIQAGQKLTYQLTGLRARQVSVQDFYDFDVIFAMDNHNLSDLQRLAPSDGTAHITLFDRLPVADPYYGTLNDFDEMFAHIQRASDHWLNLWLNQAK